jgi:hypothetical protein
MAERVLDRAKKNKADEFYTQLFDIESELKHYRDQFRGKVIFCNCDDPYESNFFKYFALNFQFLGLKQLIATCYIGSPVANTQLSLFDHESEENKTTKSPHKIIINEAIDENNDGAYNLQDIVASLTKNNKNTLTRLNDNGDFRSPECIELLKEADIVVTNPPFSLFREYVTQLMEYGKDFIIIGNKNALTYKEIFRYIKENKMRTGYRNINSDFWFMVPENYECEKIEEGKRLKHIMGCWFTNLKVKKHNEFMMLHKKYTSEAYPKYDNYDAVEVSKVAEIPADWDGVMGVPITFVDQYNPQQFAIIGLAASAGYDHEIVGLEKNSNIKDARPLINGKNTYARVFIKQKAKNHAH